MTIKELVRISRYEENIVICNGSLRRKDIVYNGSVEDIPNDLLNCIIRAWKVSLRDILNTQSYCLFVQVDNRGFSTTNESRNRRTLGKKHYTEFRNRNRKFMESTYQVVGTDGMNDLIRNFRFSGDWFRDYHRLEDLITDYYINEVEVYNDNIRSRITDIVLQEIINRYPESEEDIRDEFVW